MASTAGSTPSNSADDEIDLIAMLGKLIDKKWIVISATLICLTLGVVYTLIATPIFRANALIQVEKKSGGVPGLSEVSALFKGESASSTEIQLIKSRKVIGTAVDKLNLDIVASPAYLPVIGESVARSYRPIQNDLAPPKMGLNKYAWGGEKISVSEFSIPSMRYETAHTLIAKEGGKFELLGPNDDLILEGRVGHQATAGDYSLFITNLHARPGTQFKIIRKHRLSTILQYQAALATEEKARESGIIELALENKDPALAKKIVNVIAEAYLRQNVERQSAEAAKSLEFLRDQLPQIKKDLERAENHFNDYQVKVGSVNISAETGTLLQQVVEVESAIAELHLQQADLNRKYTTDHPAYQAWREQIAEQKNRKAELTKKIKGLPETQQELLGLKRDLEVSTQIYTQMLNNIQELDIVRAGTVGNVRIVDEAVVNVSAPIKPKKALIVAVATFLGVFLGIAIVLIRALLNKGVESPDEIEAIGLAVYASIPLSDEQRKLDRIDDKGKRLRKAKHLHPNALLAQRNPTDITIESLRSLRTSLHFAMMEAPNNIMMISGPSPNVGKSFISGNLAAVVAQAGQKVLLIDMDLRKGYMHKMFDAGSENGISDVLSKRISLAEAIQPTKVAELSFLPRGTIPPNPSELLMSQGLSDLLAEVKDQYDLIIVDTPPIMAVTDAAIVGRHCGVTMLVTRFAMNPVKELEVTKQRFEQNGITVKGVVLNAVERRASGYGYGYGYGYYHYEYKSDKT